MTFHRKVRRCLRSQHLVFLVLICIYMTLHSVQENIKILRLQHARRYHILRRNYSGVNQKQCLPHKNRGLSRSAEDYHYMDLLTEGPFHFLQNYRNPCFRQNVSTTNEQFRCLPYFFIIGFPKCGTTDLWDRMTQHPDIIALHEKESHFLDDKRFSGNDPWTIHTYLDYMNATSNEIAFNYKNGSSPDGVYHHLVTGEGTVNTAAVNDLWYELPENHDCSEPRFTNADYLKHLVPNIKIIMLLRDPVERLWSDYLYLSQYFEYTTSPEKFHSNVITAIDKYENCRNYFTARGCAYNASVDSIQTRLRMGLYVTHIKDWLRVFPKSQILILNTENYEMNIKSTLKVVFDFLSLPQPSAKLLREMSAASKSNVQNKQSAMLTHTRDILRHFYQPFNKDLAMLLKDKRCLWN